MELVFPEDMHDSIARSGRNISDVEKWASIAAGTGLALYGLSRLQASGWLFAGLGGLLLRRGVTGHCDVYEAFGVNTAVTVAGHPRRARRLARRQRPRRA